MKKRINKFIKYNKAIYAIDKFYVDNIIKILFMSLFLGIGMNIIMKTYIFLLYVLVPIVIYLDRYYRYYVGEFDKWSEELAIEKRQKLLYNQFMKKTYQ